MSAAFYNVEGTESLLQADSQLRCQETTLPCYVADCAIIELIITNTFLYAFIIKEMERSAGFLEPSESRHVVCTMWNHAISTSASTMKIEVVSYHEHKTKRWQSLSLSTSMTCRWKDSSDNRSALYDIDGRSKVRPWLSNSKRNMAKRVCRYAMTIAYHSCKPRHPRFTKQYV